MSILSENDFTNQLCDDGPFTNEDDGDLGGIGRFPKHVKAALFSLGEESRGLYVVAIDPEIAKQPEKRKKAVIHELEHIIRRLKATLDIDESKPRPRTMPKSFVD